MKVVVVYFSQTGNTRKVTETVASALRGEGHEVSVLQLNEAVPGDALGGDLFIVGTPCFASRTPTPVINFLHRLPAMEGRKALVFATSGGAPGRVLSELAGMLKKKGAVVMGGFITRGEVFHPAPSLHGRFPGRPSHEDLEHARQYALSLIAKMQELKSGCGFYETVGRLTIDPLLRLFLPEPHLVPSKCTQCHWCASTCPMSNITLEPYPALGENCIRCYCCSTGCPEKAFSVDWRWGDLFIKALYNTTFEKWFSDLKPGEEIYSRGKYK